MLGRRDTFFSTLNITNFNAILENEERPSIVYGIRRVLVKLESYEKGLVDANYALLEVMANQIEMQQEKLPTLQLRLEAVKDLAGNKLSQPEFVVQVPVQCTLEEQKNTLIL